MAVYLPRPSTAILKIAPHITEVQRPTSRNEKMPKGISSQIISSVPQFTPGKATVMVGATYQTKRG